MTAAAAQAAGLSLEDIIMSCYLRLKVSLPVAPAAGKQPSVSKERKEKEKEDGKKGRMLISISLHQLRRFLRPLHHTLVHTERASVGHRLEHEEMEKEVVILPGELSLEAQIEGPLR